MIGMRGFSSRFGSKYGILTKAIAAALILAAIKEAVDILGLNIININSLITAFLGGVFFTIGILVSGASSDYKESEKIPGDVAATLRSLYSDSKVIPMKPADNRIISRFQNNIRELLYIMNSNFRRNVWKLKEIDEAITKVNDDITELSRRGAAPNFMIKLRSELGNIDRIAHRIDTIIEARFIPAAYAIAELSIGSVILLLIFTNIELPSGGLLLFGLISVVLLSLMFLVRDMDNPFEVGRKSHADVNLDILFNLEHYWRNKEK